MTTPGEAPAVPLRLVARDVAGALDGPRGRFPDVAESGTPDGAVEWAQPHRWARKALSDVPCEANAGTVAVRWCRRSVPARTEGR